MAEYYYSSLHPEPRGKGLGDREDASSARSFGNDHDGRAFAAAMAVLDTIADVVEAERQLRHDDGLGAAAKRDRDCDKARVAPHHLDAKDALVGERRVADAVDSLERGVDGGIEADRVVGAGDVVVDRRGDDENRDAGLGGKNCRPGHRAFAAYYYQRLDQMTPQVAGREAARGLRAEFRRTRGFQEGAAALDHVGDGAAVERLGEGADKALIAAPEAYHLDSGDRRAADHGADRCVHPRRVAARGENRDSMDPLVRRAVGFVVTVHGDEERTRAAPLTRVTSGPSRTKRCELALAS